MMIDGLVKSRYSDILAAADRFIHEIALMPRSKRVGWLTYILEGLEDEYSVGDIENLLTGLRSAIDDRLAMHGW